MKTVMKNDEITAPAAPASPLRIDPSDWARLRAIDHTEPHCVLGAHPAVRGDTTGVVIRALHPDATGIECLLDGGETVVLEPIEEGGLFATFLEGARLPLTYRLRFRFANGNVWERGDPYRFAPTLGDVDLHLFNEGSHRRIWERLGAHVRRIDGVEGVAFAVWAPNARRVSVMGDFCGWDGRVFPMRRMGSSGVFELFVPDLKPEMLYKYEIKTRDGALRVKSDPYAQAMEGPPGNASRVTASSYTWVDEQWMRSREGRDPTREPMSIYEVHLGSWARVPEEGNRALTYREIAPRLCAHMKRFGFTHIELMPVAEHPLGASWGYQVTGYYAPTWRYGSPDDFRYFVDVCHQNGIGVILDWVPAHFPRDDFALRRFDGTALYEHDDPRQGEHPDWGTLIFNYDRNEVRTFLIANALYWLKEFHIDGLRIDAVASMLYLDYGREEGQWLPNRHGGKENIGALELLRVVNEAVRIECPGCITVAEESTSWSGVTRPASQYGGLGFTLKWNMGWMHDTLLYFSKDSIHRRYHQNDLTFSMLYEYSEHFVNALSHDEVVHGKRTLLEKMPGDIWQKFANLRALLAYQYTRPGKQLLFMGTELAPYNEWYYDVSLDWHLADDPMRVGLARFLEDLGRFYLESPCLWRSDPDPGGFAWIDCNDCDNSVLSYGRYHEDRMLIVVLNLTPVPRDDYRIGMPRAGRYVYRLSSDDPAYAGSGYPLVDTLDTEEFGMHGFPQSLRLTLPPLAALILEPAQ
ncbi:MAG: 1,4-alpha-glucan branching protein GlgB [Phycisphaerae bacterium]